MAKCKKIKRKYFILLLIGISVKFRRFNRKRKCWVKPWINRRHNNTNILNLVQKELLYEDSAKYRNFLRMTNVSFEKLLSKVQHKISKQDTHMRQSISAKDKLMVTLRFLATGESYRSLMYSTRIHESTISLFIPEVCEKIYLSLKDEYLKVPTTEEEWTEIKENFLKYWNIPNTLGAIDGKHIAFRPPRNAGSIFYNYKGFNSIVLLAVTDALYKFIYIDVGVNGRVSDGGVFMQSNLFKALESKQLNFLSEKPLPGRNLPVPHVLVADAAFPLKSYIMKPYPHRSLNYEQRIYNYRISRARRVVENAFGIMSNRFRIFLSTINLSSEKVKCITLAACALHNFLLVESPIYYQQTIDEPVNESFGLPITRQCGNRSSTSAVGIREEFTQYFNTTGAVPWQHKMIN